MKTKVLLISAAVVVSAGAAFHLGSHEPKCLLKMLKSDKAAESVKSEKSVTAKL